MGVPENDLPLPQTQSGPPLNSSSPSLPNDPYALEPLVTQCTLSSLGIVFRTLPVLIDTEAAGYGFIDETIARQVCETLGIQPVPLSRPKAILLNMLHDKLIFCPRQQG